jgi:hypothetical protein
LLFKRRKIPKIVYVIEKMLKKSMFKNTMNEREIVTQNISFSASCPDCFFFFSHLNFIITIHAVDGNSDF